MPKIARPAILLVSVGAAAEKGAPALLNFGKKVETAFPNHIIRWAFTMPHTGKRPLFQGERGASVDEAFMRLVAENHMHIVVLPLHLVDGLEHATLSRQIEILRQKHPKTMVSLGSPLLTDEASIRAALKAMQLAAPPFSDEIPDPEEAVAWVGHGSTPPHDAAYRQLATLAEMLTPRHYVGCLIGCRSADETLAALMKDGWKKVCLMPLFTLAGHHAANDLGGDGPDSWRSRLHRAGIKSRIHLRGMLEHEAFAAMWLDRLREALQKSQPT